METKFCTVCKEIKDLNKFTLNPDGSIRKHVCKACWAKKWRAQLKLEMLEAFGWKCQCCGENNPHFLTLDHINNDGNKHRAEVNSGSVEVIYSAAKKEGWPKDKYQLLCINCNWAKGKWGTCPHQVGQTSEQVIEEYKSKLFSTGKTLQDYSNNAGLKLGPLSQKIDPTVLREHRLANSKKQKNKQDLKALLEKAGVKDVNNLLASISK